MALAQQVFTQNGTFGPVPGGVNQVTVTTIKNPISFPSKMGGSNIMGFHDARGNLYLCGNNSLGQLGIGSTANSSSPVLNAGLLQFVQSDGNFGGGGAVIALTPQGRVYGTGVNTSGELGINTSATVSSFTSMAGSTLIFQKVRMGSSFSFALTIGGFLYSMGNNLIGQLGDGTVVAKSLPTLVVGSLLFQDVTVDQQNSNSSTAVLGLRQDGVLMGWGGNQNGQLGLGDVNSRSSPALVLGSLLFQKVLMSGGNVLGLTTGGQLYGWGANSQGVLGDGTSTPRSSPVLVAGGLLFTDFSIASGFISQNTACALATSGLAYAWGANQNGQLGDGTIVAKSSPVLISGALTFVKLRQVMGENSGGGQTMFGLTAAGLCYAWGSSANGQIGDGTTVAKSSPTLVTGGLVFTDLVAANGSIYATNGAGLLYGWGYNGNGQLGLGDITPRSSPVLMLGSLAATLTPQYQTTIIPVTPGQSYAVGLTTYQATFGVGASQTVIGAGKCDSVTVQFDQ